MEAENALEMDRALATFKHPRYEIIATGEIYDGAEEVAQYYRESRTVFPDQRNELISLRHADDAVIVEFWLLGTHKGPLGWLEPTGRDFKCRMTAFFIFEGTALTCERVYFDSATIRRQLTGAS
jgi:predicted ester cyclase